MKARGQGTPHATAYRRQATIAENGLTYIAQTDGFQYDQYEVAVPFDRMHDCFSVRRPEMFYLVFLDFDMTQRCSGERWSRAKRAWALRA